MNLVLQSPRAKSLVCENPLHPIKRIKAFREGIKIITRGMVGVGLKQGSQSKIYAAKRSMLRGSL